MTLEIFLKKINEFVIENPNVLKLEVITSSDNEGNNFNKVIYDATKGFFENNNFIPFSVYKEHNINKNKTNAVCIN
ncbi:MAG: hypothetical protein ACPG5B_06890 [Chitinophagales bacterium]